MVVAVECENEPPRDSSSGECSEKDAGALLLSRSNNVLQKRKEQLRRWQESDTNTASSNKRTSKRVKFQDCDVFLSACTAGDTTEVGELLLKGAFVDTATVDGLTGLHQAVIDGHMDMVRFLVEHGAGLDTQDNEGWTPLHAAACCEHKAIAKYLLDMGCNPCVTNCDKELPVDLCESTDLRDILLEHMRRLGTDPAQCRDMEERDMLDDALRWCDMDNGGAEVEKAHPRSGARPLHVAASKGYLRVLSVLLQQCNADVLATDADGWTPLHAAAHWGERDACRMLAEKGADFKATSRAGQTCFDVADPEMVPYLEELQRGQEHGKIAPSGVGLDTLAVDANMNRRKFNRRRSPVPSDGNKNSVPHLSTEEKAARARLDEVKEHATLVTVTKVPDSGPTKVSKETDANKEIDIPKVVLPVDRHVPTRRVCLENSTGGSSDSTTPVPAIKTDGVQLQSQLSDTLRDEAEAERKAKSKRERANRRSTQGVTHEQIMAAIGASRVETSDSGGKAAVVAAKPVIAMPSNDDRKEWRQASGSNTPPSSGTPSSANAAPFTPWRSRALAQSTAATSTVTNASSAPHSNASSSGKAPTGHAPIASSNSEDNNVPSDPETGQGSGSLAQRYLNAVAGGSSSDTRESTPELRLATAARTSTATSTSTSTSSPACTSALSTNSTSATSKQHISAPTAVGTAPKGTTVDFERLYEREKGERIKLSKRVAELEQQLRRLKVDADNRQSATQNGVLNKTADSPVDERQRRQYERRIAELEEEAKNWEKLRTDNVRLKEENGALIRVISKLSK